MTKISSFCSFLMSICQNTNFEGNLGGSTIRGLQVLGKLTLKSPLSNDVTCHTNCLKGKRELQWFDLKTVHGCEQNS